MTQNLIPISTLFIGINGAIGLVLSFIVAMERGRTRVWHGESNKSASMQPNPLENPNVIASTVENLSDKLLSNKTEYADLQRKVRAHGNFTEYVPLGLMALHK